MKFSSYIIIYISHNMKTNSKNKNRLNSELNSKFK